jgi:class III poly(R)-hydroxyalkanoic acid synthase PhaE subunit
MRAAGRGAVRLEPRHCTGALARRMTASMNGIRKRRLHRDFCGAAIVRATISPSAEVAMSDTKSGHDWSKDWQALQSQYWSAWSDLTRNQAGATPDAATPWHEGLEQWSRMFGSAGKQSDAADRLMSSAKDYLNLMQSMMTFASGKGGGPVNAQSWLETLRSAFNMPGVAPGLMNNPLAKMLRDMSGNGVRSFEQLASGATPMLEQMQQEGLSWLRAPAFGYAREHQEHYQKMLLAFADFQEAVKQYNALIMKASQRSFEIAEGKLAERSEPGRQIDSVRALYDLWVDAAEEAYAEVALSQEFRKVYGDVVNAQMRVRSQLQQEVERIGVDLGMPTRTELNSVHKRLHDLRRELRASQEARREADHDGRDAQIAAMRAEIDDLRRLVSNSPAAPLPRAATAPKARVRRKRSPARRKSAAKRAHVATKSTPIVKPVPVPIKPVVVRVQRTTRARKTARGATRRPDGRAAQATRARSSATKSAAAAKAGPGAPSFRDAIAAMRQQFSRQKRGKKKKVRAARFSLPSKTSSAMARSRRSRS